MNDIGQDRLDEASRRLAEGQSVRAVARAMRLNRDIIVKIRDGTYRKRGQPTHHKTAEYNRPYFNESGLVEWCSACGHLVRPPCHACRVRAEQKPQKPARISEYLDNLLVSISRYRLRGILAEQAGLAPCED